MTEKRNTDWTDRLRERLSDSELSPSADVWSKVENAVVPSREAVPATAWWGFACAAAAAAVVLFMPPKGDDLIEVVHELQPTALGEAVTLVDEYERAESVTAAVTRGRSDKHADAVASTAPGNPAELAVTDAPAVPSAAECSAAPAVADSPAVEDEPTMEYGFDSLPEERAKPRKKMGVLLFASGIPGYSGQNSRPDLYFVHNGISSDNTKGEGLPIISYSGNNAVVINDYYGLIARNSGLVLYENVGLTNEGVEYFQLLGREVRHHRPVSVGVSLTYPLVRNVFLESGLSYTFLRSEYAGGLGDQRLHFLGVPLKLGYRFNTPSAFSVVLSAGAMAEKCIYGELFGSQIAVKEPIFSAVATASVHYSLGQNLSLFVAPDLSYYFTRTSVPTYRTERPLSMTLRLGVNVNIDK